MVRISFFFKLLVAGCCACVSLPLAHADIHCDIPGEAFASKSAASAQACEDACQGNAECTRWVYVSGWGRCSLKKVGNVSRRLRIWAAQAGSVVVQDHDHSGKDFKKISQISSAEACLKQCTDATGCQGMAYLDGYKDCYLKNTAGKLVPKTFFCGIRQAEKAK